MTRLLSYVLLVVVGTFLACSDSGGGQQADGSSDACTNCEDGALSDSAGDVGAGVSDVGETTEEIDDTTDDVHTNGETDGAEADSGFDTFGAGDGGADVAETSRDPYQIVTPWNFAPGAPTPVVIRSTIGPISAQVTIQVGTASKKAQLYRGIGSALFVVPEAETVTAKVTGTAGFTAITLAATARPTRLVSGVLTGDALVWSAIEDIVVTDDSTVPTGDTLVVASGVRVHLMPTVNLVIKGAIDVQGTAEAPVLFTSKDNTPWGGVRVMGGNASFHHTWFSGGGGDGDYVFGHSDSQPVVYVQDGQLSLTGGGVVDNPGKAFGSKNARVTLTGTLVSRCDTGGEFDTSMVTMTDATVVEIPDGDGGEVDDDNDCMYLVGALVENATEKGSTLTNIVLANGKDDGIDHNGARVVVTGAWIENMAHEGIAASNGRGIEIKNSVVRQCVQGIEAGYGDPDVVVDHCLVTENQVGLRFGDEYDWKATGKLTVRNTISVKNNVQNVLNDDAGSGGEVPGAIDIECSMVHDAVWDGKNGNLPGVPSWGADYCLLSGSPGKNAGCDGKDVGLSACLPD